MFLQQLHQEGILLMLWIKRVKVFLFFCKFCMREKPSVLKTKSGNKETFGHLI